jgi:antitoxin Phd
MLDRSKSDAWSISTDWVDPMTTWQETEAKARFGELIDRAIIEGPQTITRRGAACAVVLSVDEYLALQALKPDFKAHLLGGPKVDEFDLRHDLDFGRAVEL